MKKLLVAVMLVAFAATAAMAVEDVYTYTGKGTITFNHKAHGEKLGCEACHKGTPAKIDVSTKDAGHALCLECHKSMKDKGAPTKCNDCHVK